VRSSRETELCERFPIHVVAEWPGNSPKTALAHYTQVSEDHYRKAVQHVSAEARTASQEGTGRSTDCESLRDVATPGVSVQGLPMTPTGFDLPPDSPGKTAVLPQGGAKSGADSGRSATIDPDLQRVIKAWPGLAEPVRRAVLALVEGAGKRT
jgi:hypothetical protein